MSEPLLVNAAEAARLLSVNRKTLWNHTAPRGAIPAVRMGRVLRYSPAELRAWIQRQNDSQKGIDGQPLH